MRSHPYDRVVTGAVLVKPNIEGIDLPNVFALHSMDESFAVKARLDQKPKSAVIVGAGKCPVAGRCHHVHQSFERT